MKKLRKAVFPVAGLGTRILPATKAMPKEMLTIVDKPLIQYAMEEALEAGIEHFIFVTSRGKSSLEDHFDIAFELEATLALRGKSDAPLSQTRFSPGSISYVRQQQPLGLGHAIWCARELVGDEPFAVLLPDDLMVGEPGCLKQMAAAYESHGGNIICTQQIAADQTHKYGIVVPDGRHNTLTKIAGMVEKPAPADAPSNLAIVGRYILQPEIMAVLSNLEKGAGGEIQLTDALARNAGKGDTYGHIFDGKRYDCGDSAGFVIANIALAMGRPHIAETVGKFWRDMLAEQAPIVNVPEIVAANA
jgi:UTP--glucose-1-phosphate uridylyltransferase